MTYSLLDSCGNHSISAKYVVDNLLMCGIRVNTHTHSHRAYLTEISVNVLAIPFSQALLTVSSDLYLCNTVPPLRVVVVEALYHYITALSVVGIHRVFPKRRILFYTISNKINYNM